MSTERFTSLDAILPYVVAEVPNCPPVIVRQKIIEAARELCDFSRCWRYELDPISIRANVRDYDLDGWPREAEVCGVILAEIRDASQDDALMERLDPGYSFDLIDKRSIRLTSKPGAAVAKGLRITVWLKPKPDGTRLDEQVYSDHYQRIARGALGMLQMMPGKTWSNPGLGQRNEAMFAQDKGFARIEADRGPGMTTQERMMPRDSFL